MSYDQTQNSESDSRIAYLYEFTYGENKAFRYCSTTTHLFTLGRSWQAAPMSYGAINVTAAMERQPLEILVPILSEIARLFTVAPPAQPVSVTIYRGDYIENDYVVQWTGRVVSLQTDGVGEATLHCTPTLSTLQRRVMRRKYQPGCPHVLYGDTGCKVPIELHSETGIVLEVVSSLRIRVRLTSLPHGIADSTVAGGIINVVMPDGMLVQRTIIEAENVGPREYIVKMLSYAVGILPDMEVSIAKGCDHTFTTCRDRFANASNFGGCPNIPEVDPSRNNTF
jgi:uncharacterized phage protein (TIGR02218 family)